MFLRCAESNQYEFIIVQNRLSFKFICFRLFSHKRQGKYSSGLQIFLSSLPISATLIFTADCCKFLYWENSYG